MTRRSGPIVISNRQALAGVFVAGLLAGLVGYLTIDRRDVTEVVWRVARGTRLEKDVIRWHLTDSKDTAVPALAKRQIQAGDSVEAVIAEYGPFHVETYGRYQTLSDPLIAGGFSFEGYTIVAKRGRLVAAGWSTCVGGLTFFDTLTPAEAAEYIVLRDAERERRYQVRRAADMAVAGPLGLIALFEPPPPDPEP